MKALSRTNISILLQSALIFLLYAFLMYTVLYVMFGPIMEHVDETDRVRDLAAVVLLTGSLTFGFLRGARFWKHQRQSLGSNSTQLVDGRGHSAHCAPPAARPSMKVLRTVGWGMTALSILTLPAVFESYVLDRCSALTLATSIVSVAGFSFLALCISEFRHRRLLSVGLKAAVVLSVVYGCLAVIAGVWKPVMDYGHCKWPWLVLSALIYGGFAYGVRLKAIEVERMGNRITMITRDSGAVE